MQNELHRFKACIHCKHFRGHREGKTRECHHLAASLARSFVDGQPQWARAEQMRAKGNKHCGPEGKLWAPIPTPLRDRAAAIRLGAAWYAGRATSAMVAPFAAAGQWAADYRAALRAVRDNTAAADPKPEQPKPEPQPIPAPHPNPPIGPQEDNHEGMVPLAKDGQPIEPLPKPDDEAPKPKPGDLPQTDGRALVPVLARDPRKEAAPGLAIALGALALLVGIMTAQALGMVGAEMAPPTATQIPCVAGRETCCERGNPAKCYPCQRAAGKALCCYRMPNGETKCWDCSTKV